MVSDKNIVVSTFKRPLPANIINAGTSNNNQLDGFIETLIIPENVTARSNTYPAISAIIANLNTPFFSIFFLNSGNNIIAIICDAPPNAENRLYAPSPSPISYVKKYITRLLVRYNDVLTSIIAITTIIAWSLDKRDLNISFIPWLSTLSSFFSFTLRQHITSDTTNITATAKAQYLKPMR